MNVSKSTIKLYLDKLATSENTINTGVSINPIHEQPLNSNVINSDVSKNASVVSKNNQTSASSSTINTTTGTGHHIGFQVQYTGQQPINVGTWQFRSIRMTRFEKEDYVIQFGPKTMMIWPRMQGSSVKEIEQRSYGRARVLAGQFASKFSLHIDWTTFKRMNAEVEITLPEGDLNDSMMAVISPERPKFKEQGILDGDSSHKTTEFNKDKGRANFDALMKLINDYAEIQGVSGQNTQAIEEMRYAITLLTKTMLDMQVQEKKARIDFQDDMRFQMTWIGETLRALVEKPRRFSGSNITPLNRSLGNCKFLKSI